MSTQTKTTIFATVLFLLFVFIAWSFYPHRDQPTDFSSCVAGSFPVLETLPRQCLGPNGKVFEEDLSNVEKILATQPENQATTTVIASPDTPTNTSTTERPTTSPILDNLD